MKSFIQFSIVKKKTRNLILLSAFTLFFQPLLAMPTGTQTTNNWSSYRNNTLAFNNDSIAIRSAADFAQIAYLVNNGRSFADTTFVLADNIDLSAHYWTPIGNETYPFSGNFDGNNKNIDGLYINITQSSSTNLYEYYGLFGVSLSRSINPNEIKNITITQNSYIYIKPPCYGCIGSICGECLNTDILNCTNNCEIKTSGITYVGGILGQSYNTVKNCVNNATITGSDVGGIINNYSGPSFNKLSKCTNNGTLNIYGSNGGGIAAQSIFEIDSCVNTGNLLMSQAKTGGGIVGNLKYSIINQCYNSGNISGLCLSGGGIAGYVLYEGEIKNCTNSGFIDCSWKSADNGTEVYCGGIAGKIENSYIYNCANTGSIKGYSFYCASFTGGIAGNATSKSIIKNCANYGLVNSSSTYDLDACGGISGCLYLGSTMSSCINTGTVTAKSKTYVTYRGGIVGNGTPGNISNCYYDKQMCIYKGFIDKDVNDSVEGKLTSEIVGTGLQNLLHNDSLAWTFSEGGYPRVSTTNVDVATIGTIPIFLSDTSSLRSALVAFQKTDSVMSNFKVGELSGLSWNSKSNRLSIKGSAVSLLLSGADTLVATYKGIIKAIPLNIIITSATSIKTADSEKMPTNVYVHNHNIVINNAEDPIAVYNITGSIIAKSNEVNTQIAVTGTGIYIVKIGAKTTKIMVK